MVGVVYELVTASLFDRSFGPWCYNGGGVSEEVRIWAVAPKDGKANKMVETSAYCNLYSLPDQIKENEGHNRRFRTVMEAVSTSETSVNIYQTARRNVSEESSVHEHRREN